MTLARFTPSVLDGDTLERLFVQRHHLLDDVMAAVTDAAGGVERRHKLFIGPRGAGKTHLLSLVNHRVRKARANGLQVGLSWLMEDPWDIETYDDLLGQVLENLDGGAPEGNSEYAVHRVVEATGPIVVLVENLDQILTAIGPDGQRRFRALLENDRPILLVATSTRLSDDLLSQAEPFYGFFDVTQLEPFSVEQAADMLWHVADYAGDESLASLLKSPQATPRLATIAHLAGGQPRVWALLGTGLTDTGIDDMVDMLLARFDDLTPYYQEQLARLSPSERKAVRRLADADRPLTVRDLAELARTDQRSMSKTVSDLRKRGWIRKHESALTASLDARLSYYELAEPLARIAFQMKAARGEPVRLVVDFLSTWFEREELAGRTADDASAGATYRHAAQRSAGLATMLVRALSERGGKFPDAHAGAAGALADIETALARLDQVGDASEVMLLPAPISQLIAERMRTKSVIELRLLVSEFAVMHRAPGDWRSVLDDLSTRVAGEQHARTVAALTVLADTPAARDALLDQLDSEISPLPVWQTEEVLGWLLMSLIGSRWQSPEFLLTVAERPSVSRSGLELVRYRMRFAAAYDYAQRGDREQAERIAREEFRDASAQAPSSEQRMDATFGLAAVLIEVGSSREGLALLDAEFKPGDPLWGDVELLRARAAANQP